MPIIASEAPKAAFDAIFQALNKSADEFIIRKPGAPALSSRSLSLCVPHRFAYLPAHKIKRGGSLREAVQIEDWCYLVVEEKRAAAPARGDAAVKYAPVATVTALAGEGGKYEFGTWHDGPFAAGTELAIRTAEKDRRVSAGEYEPFLLIAPAVYLTALWLKDRGKGGSEETDLILPIPPSNLLLMPFEPISPRYLFDKLHATAASLPSDHATV